MVLRGRQQDEWNSEMHRAMQAELGQQLKTAYGLPTELTPKLNALVSAMDKPMELRSARYKLQASVAEFAKLQCEP